MAHTRLDRYERLYSHRTGSLRSSAMRDLMAVTSRPEVISLAGGLPDTRAFPPDLLGELLQEVASEHGPRALQYGPTEGLHELRQALADHMARLGMVVGAGELIVTTGGQQAIDLVCRVLLDPGDPILAEGPTYPGAVPVFSACGADVHHVAMDEDGLRIDALTAAHDALVAEGRPPKLLYVIPTFHNPAGVTLSLERRRALVAFAQDRDLLILEDDPYSTLRFEGEPLPSLRSLDATGRVVYLGTLSKIFSPGIRVGWIHAPHPILHRVNLSKQGADLCSSPLAQLLGLAFLEHERFGEVVGRMNRLYAARRDAMVEALAEALPDATHVVPQGGLFLWATLANGLDTTDLLAAALERDVAFVPGAAAYLDGVSGRSSLRLNFSAMDEERIVEGIRRIGGVVRERAALAHALTPRARRTTGEG
ncbi:MAG: Transcriptional regulator, GntR family domain / Aspartate aminotransferase [uncultured Thermoleophilia bacterium]|uniref:Transcriptional regulator, GntR family domain / Aspartate aminotransferase n=1 Tax=uncultured Thermoleophilia bacterium TaxID=1497501 RepID=A0A6J4U6Z5_9ACTN|nr:MAG: Transcriptional regulator, GntR family domain / Aspartate aminotransferase [uncultured Thermoleophilia bacterium]